MDEDDLEFDEEWVPAEPVKFQFIDGVLVVVAIVSGTVEAVAGGLELLTYKLAQHANWKRDRSNLVDSVNADIGRL